LIGDYDKNEKKFLVTSQHKFNFGSSFPGGVHAPSATPDGKGGIITIFNMNSARETEGQNPFGWDQIMTLPRRIGILGNNNIEKDMLKIEPAGDIESLRYNKISKSNILLPANEEICFNEINGNCLEIIAQIDMNSAPMIELNVLRSPRKEEFTRICFFANRGYRNWERYDNWDTKRRMEASDGIISIDSSQSSLSSDTLSRPPETAPVYLEPKENLELRVFIDKSVLEVFVNNKQCIAMRIYPSRKDSTGISFKSQGETSKILRLLSWKMKTIY
jgi:beta-fructofuranosidase